MYQLALLRLLLLPSIFSAVAVCALAIGSLGYFSWQYIQDNEFFYDYLFGPSGVQAYLWNQSAGPTSGFEAFMSSPALYYVAVTLVAIVSGIAIYTALQIIRLLRNKAAKLNQQQVSYTAPPEDMRVEATTRLALRIIILFSWFLYTILFFSMVMQLALLSTEAGLQNVQAGKLSGLLLNLAGIFVLALGLHLHVVFARLSLLRARVFGGDQYVEEIESRRNPPI